MTAISHFSFCLSHCMYFLPVQYYYYSMYSGRFPVRPRCRAAKFGVLKMSAPIYICRVLGPIRPDGKSLTYAKRLLAVTLFLLPIRSAK
ncbi:hypothetical protein FKM82_031341 [Ascaphus truei]